MLKKKLLVFVSSTFNDLKEERQAAVQAILKAGHIPAGMELFTAGDKSQLQTIYNWIDQCDVYMLILGGRYGSLEPESKVSYTELEYDYAREAGKPFFATVISEPALDEKSRILGQAAFERDNPTQLKQFREKVLQSISSFFSDTKDIKLCVHESLSDFSLDPSLTGWVSGKDIPDSSSIQKEIEELRIENDKLRKALSKSTPKVNEASEDERFSELRQILENTEVLVPKSFLRTATSDETRSLHHLLVSAADILVSGVTSQPMNNEYKQFMYRSVIPKLQIHGLAENEKVAGVTYRRAALNKEGQRYLSWVERTKKKKKRDET